MVSYLKYRLSDFKNIIWKKVKKGYVLYIVDKNLIVGDKTIFTTFFDRILQGESKFGWKIIGFTSKFWDI